MRRRQSVVWATIAEQDLTAILDFVTRGEPRGRCAASAPPGAKGVLSRNAALARSNRFPSCSRFRCANTASC